MELHYTLNANDLHAFARFWSSRRATHHKKRYTVVPLALILTLGLSMLLFPTGFLDIKPLDALVAILPPLLIFVLVLTIGTVLHRKAVEKTFDGRSVVRLLDDGIHHGDEQTESRTRWEALRSVAETPTHVFLVYGYQQAVIIPKRALSGDELDTLRSVISGHRPELKALS